MSGRRGRNPGSFVDVISPSAGVFVTRDFGGGGPVSSGDVTLSLPAGGAGQMLVAIIGFRGSPAFTMPSGWSVARQVTDASTANSGPTSFLFAYKVRGASEPTPTFTRLGGSQTNGNLIGYTPSRGSLAFDAVSGTTGNTASPLTLPSLAVASPPSLIVAAFTHGSFWNFPQAGFVAANMTAAAASGVFVASPTGVVSGTEWGNAAIAARSFGGVSVGTQVVDVWRAPAGSMDSTTGAMTSPFPGGNYNGAAVSFRWTP